MISYKHIASHIAYENKSAGYMLPLITNLKVRIPRSGNMGNFDENKRYVMEKSVVEEKGGFLKVK